MNIDEVRLLIKQLGKELYADSPERQTRGPFSVDTYEGPMTKEQKLADVEAYQAEMAEKEVYRDSLMDLEDALVDASPSVGEKLIANFINLFPMGKRSSTGIGSLVGKEIGEMTEAEAARIAEAQAEVTKYNQMQQEGEPLNSFQMQKKNDAEGILSALPSTGSPGTQEKYFEQLHKSRQLPTSPQMLEEYEAYQDSKGRIEMASGLFMTRAEFEGLMDLDLSDVENLSEAEQDLMIKYNLDVKDIPKGPPKELKDVNENLQGLFDFTDNLLSKDLKPKEYINSLSIEDRLDLYLDPLEGSSPEALLLDSEEIDYYQDIVDWEQIPDEFRSDDKSQNYPRNNLTKAFLEKSNIEERREGDLVKDFRGAPYYQEIIDATGKSKVRVYTPIERTDYGMGPKYSSKSFNNPTYKELKDWLASKNIKGYKDGGVIMNYGDYGRSYI